MKWDASSAEIYDALYQLGLTANYTGFFHTADAIRLALKTPQRLCLVTKWIYPDVAAHCPPSAGAVERNIRTAVSRIWEKSPEQLCRFSRAPLSRKPTNAQFLGILVAYLSQAPPP